MKKAMHFVLDEEEIIELIRILMDEDAEGALAFLKHISRVRPANCLRAVKR